MLRHPLARDIGVVAGWFVVVGLVGAVVWWQLTPLAEYTRTETSAQMGEGELGRQVSVDAWFFLVAAVGGLISGVVLLLWRSRDPLMMVLLVMLGAVLATFVMLYVGLWLGPANPKSVLADAAVGAKVPIQLKPRAAGLYFVWPVAALIGAAGVLWSGDTHQAHTGEQTHDPARNSAQDPTFHNDGIRTTHSG